MAGVARFRQAGPGNVGVNEAALRHLQPDLRRLHVSRMNLVGDPCQELTAFQVLRRYVDRNMHVAMLGERHFHVQDNVLEHDRRDLTDHAVLFCERNEEVWSDPRAIRFLPPYQGFSADASTRSIVR